jgi:hypothetical protein
LKGGSHRSERDSISNLQHSWSIYVVLDSLPVGGHFVFPFLDERNMRMVAAGRCQLGVTLRVVHGHELAAVSWLAIQVRAHVGDNFLGRGVFGSRASAPSRISHSASLQRTKASQGGDERGLVTESGMSCEVPHQRPCAPLVRAKSVGRVTRRFQSRGGKHRPRDRTRGRRSESNCSPGCSVICHCALTCCSKETACYLRKPPPKRPVMVVFQTPPSIA